VLARHSAALLDIAHVVGVAESAAGGEPVIRVLVDGDASGARSGLPREIEGYRVVVDSTGALRAPPPG
jgi:hypothetical protein